MLYLESMNNAGVAELVDAHDSKSCILGCAGSTPATGTIQKSLDFSSGIKAFFLTTYSYTCIMYKLKIY